MPTLRLSNAAVQDLIEIDACTLREWGEKRADTYLGQLESCFSRLIRNPMLGRSCFEIREGLRRLEHKKHVVFYRYIEETIVVLRILH